MSNRAKVLFFANLREKTGVHEIMVEFKDGAMVSDIKTMLLDMYPKLKTYKDTIIVAMDHEFAFDEYHVKDGAEIALFPPVSGGEADSGQFPTIISIVNQEIEIHRILDQITLSTTGAACLFTGIVRGVTRRTHPHQTEELDYEAYNEMAERKMKQISDEIRIRWNEIEGIALIQRTGKLIPGMISVVVACTSSHRDSGIFEAARYGIDRIKEIVPVWKKEISRDGEVWVEGDYIPHRDEYK